MRKVIACCVGIFAALSIKGAWDLYILHLELGDTERLFYLSCILLIFSMAISILCSLWFQGQHDLPTRAVHCYAADMTDSEAQEEAVGRWGADGAAWHPAYTKPGQYRYCAVGEKLGECRDDWLVFGRGETFEDAFVDAQRRGN